VARPRKRRRPQVSLFPFLSVLACVIGALTLLIAATAVGRVASDTVDLELYERLEREIARDRRRLAELSALAEEVATLGEEIDAARSEKQRLAGDAEQALAALERNAPLRQKLARAEDRQRALEREAAALDERASERREALARRQAELATAPILIQPSGSGYGLEPHFAECRRDGLVLYEGLERHKTQVPLHRIGTSAEYRRFLRSVRLREGATVVFLVRPGGVPACRQASIQAAVVRHGEIPLAGDGELDFSLLGESRL
jgi:Skp family chaperone for outer membrane proteins